MNDMDMAQAKERKTTAKTWRNPLKNLLQDVLGSYKHDFIAILRRELSARLIQHKTEVAEMLRAEVTEVLRSEVQRSINLFQEAEVARYRNVQFASQRLALLESAEFVKQNMLKAATFPHPHATLEHALSLAPQGGLALEFGVYSGSTLKLITAARKGCDTYGFDSFKGLPESWRSGFPTGAFAVNELPVVDGAELVAGWFDDTLPRFLESHEGAIDFLHVDCDLYSSTKTVLDLAGQRLRPGSIVMFDEFFNYPGWQQHEFKAWMEYVERTGLRFNYEAYTLNNEQVVARIVSA
ncbi:MAG: class I SAM-dependent methyltransferase [Stenotrophobium sp.]